MTVVIGLAPNERGAAAVHLGSMLARSLSDRVVVAIVVPTPWPPNPYRVDAEYLALQEENAQEALAVAHHQIGADLSVTLVTRHAGSVASGLLDIVREHEATLVALGSSASGGLGVVSLGGVADRILHSLEIPVTLAPTGFDTGLVDARVTRITVAYGRADRDSDLLLRSAAMARQIGASLRVACFAVRPQTAAAGSIEGDAEDLVVQQWADHIERDITSTLASSDLDPATADVDIVVGQGGTWPEAMADVAWNDSGEIVVVGASSSVISRFLLGSHASKIVRSSTVPVFLMSRNLAQAHP